MGHFVVNGLGKDKLKMIETEKHCLIKTSYETRKTSLEPSSRRYSRYRYIHAHTHITAHNSYQNLCNL